jgi:hypothetical protein
MHKWILTLPVILLAGCSKSNPPISAVPPVTEPVEQAQATPPTGERPAVVATSPFGSEAAAAPANLVIPKGTALHVRLDEAVNTRRNRAGDQFHASLAEPLVLNGKMLLPRGTPITGHVTESQASGRLEGRAELALTLDSFRLEGKDYRVHTGSIDRVSASHKKRNIALIGGGSGLGAVIGAIAGGGKGALIGAGAGAAAGTAGAVATGKREVGLAAESLLTFSLQAPVEL